jgi:hypothetical protein
MGQYSETLDFINVTCLGGIIKSPGRLPQPMPISAKIEKSSFTKKSIRAGPSQHRTSKAFTAVNEIFKTLKLR